MAFTAGVGIFAILDKRDKLMQQRSLFLGEVLLLGNVLIVGEMVTFSFTHLYHGLNLWLLVSLNLLFLFLPKTRAYLKFFFNKFFTFGPGSIIFVVFLALFTFRNCFPLMDNDSHSTYLWMPKLWVQHGTSIFKDVIDVRAHFPHLESVPYALGMVLFGQDTLFQSLINLMWRWIALLLVFGYVSYRFNTFYGLAAALFVMLNDHFFYSGINYSVLLNGAVIAFIFGAVYNFWESRVHGDPFRFMLAIIFLSQVFATKGLLVFVVVFLMGFMLLFQKDLLRQTREILSRKNWLIPIMVAVYFTLFWLIRNYCVTGLATFPLMAGKFYIHGWTPESDRVRWAAMGGLKFPMALKYLTYLFIWPGVNAAKIVIVTIIFLPLIMLWTTIKNRFDKEAFLELCFWLGVSLLIVIGIVMTGHQDPRYYRYGIGVFAFAAVYAVRFILLYGLKVKYAWAAAGMLLLMSLAPMKIIFRQGTGDHFPSFVENGAVLLDKLHTEDVMDKFYPRNAVALKSYHEHWDKAATAAWSVTPPVLTSNFMLPERPHVGFWYSPMVRWDSYSSEALIAQDIRNQGIDWIMDAGTGAETAIRFLTPEAYAKEAIKFDRYPKHTFFQYELPEELKTTGL